MTHQPLIGICSECQQPWGNGIDHKCPRLSFREWIRYLITARG